MNSEPSLNKYELGISSMVGTKHPKDGFNKVTNYVTNINNTQLLPSSPFHGGTVFEH